MSLSFQATASQRNYSTKTGDVAVAGGVLMYEWLRANLGE
jgi:hypothetical protein